MVFDNVMGSRYEQADTRNSSYEICSSNGGSDARSLIK